MTNESMLERVALAISCDGFVDDGDRRAARAAIEAMREPTQAQYDALCARRHPVINGFLGMTANIVWQTYIDAILREGVGR